MSTLHSLFFANWPSFILAAVALLCMVTAVWQRSAGFCLTNILAMLAYAVAGYGFGRAWYVGAAPELDWLLLDRWGNGLGVLVCLSGLMTLIFSYHYWRAQKEIIREVFPLLLFSSFGMTLMLQTTHLLLFVLGLEVMSLSLYGLVALRRHDPRASEAAFKYFLLGSVASAFLLLGVAFLYGVTGTLELREMAGMSIAPELSLMFKLGAILVFLGLAFKVGAFPFHFWAPDAYDGAPTPVTGFMATGVKVAAFGALVHFLQVFSAWQALNLPKLLLGLSIATQIVGSFTALRQKSLKRILAYSSIAHAGYLLLGLATLVAQGEWHASVLSALVTYLAIYSLLSLGIFGILTLWSSDGQEIGDVDDLRGWAKQRPVLAACLALFLISLAGIPPFAGFFAKYYLFSQAVAMGYTVPAVIGVLTSAISLYYYLAPVVRMYFEEPVGEARGWKTSWVAGVALVVLVGVVTYLGVFPQHWLVWVEKI